MLNRQTGIIVTYGLGLCVLGAVLCGSVNAQSGPRAATTPPLADVDPHLQELVRRSRLSNVELAESIRDALRLNLNSLVDQFFSTVASRNLPPQELASMAEMISSERLLRVTVSVELGEASKQQAKAMMAALRTQQQDTAKLQQAIKSLSSSSVDQRLGAMRVLLAGSEKSVEVLSMAIAATSDNQARDQMVSVLVKLGEGGKDSLRQLAIYGSPELRSGALHGLARIDENVTKPIAVAMAYDPAAPAAGMEYAKQWLLKRYPKLPSEREAELYLLDRLTQAKSAIQYASRRSDVVMLWAIGADGKSLVHQRVTAELAAFRNFIDHARLLRQLPKLSSDAANEGLSAELAYQYEIDPLGIEVDRAPILNIWGADSLSAEHLNTLLRLALEREDLAVAISILHLIDETMRADAEYLLASNGPSLTPLVAASLHAQPRVRFSAAIAISRLEYDRPYTGCSEVLKRWIEMSQLSREPLILLVETRNELVGQLERELSSIGYRLEVAPTVQAAIQAVDKGGDLRFVISTSILPDRSSLEMVDLIRRRPLGKDLPILLHGPKDQVVDQAVTDQRWSAPVVHFEIPVSPAGWDLIFSPLEASRPITHLTAVERIDFRQAAARALGRIASNPNRFSFYDLHQLEQTVGLDTGMTDESAPMAFGSAQLSVLSVTPTRQSQSILGAMAVQSGLAEDKRTLAVDALLFSIDRHGNLLTAPDIQQIDKSYDELLQSGQLPPDSSVERLLRSIYKRVGQTDI